MLYSLSLSFLYQRDKEAVLPWIAGDYSPGIIILCPRELIKACYANFLLKLHQLSLCPKAIDVTDMLCLGGKDYRKQMLGVHVPKNVDITLFSRFQLHPPDVRWMGVHAILNTGCTRGCSWVHSRSKSEHPLGVNRIVIR